MTICKFGIYGLSWALFALVIAVTSVNAAEPAVQGDENHVLNGAITGIVRTGSRMPVGGATVTAIHNHGDSIRATVSGSDGIYSFADLAPGGWSLTVQAEGFPESPAATIEVNAGKAARLDLVVSMAETIMSLPKNRTMANAALAPAPPQTAAAPANVVPDSIWSRWAHGDRVTLKDVDEMYREKARERQARTTASLSPPPPVAFTPVAAGSAEPSAQSSGGSSSPEPAAAPVEKPGPAIPKSLQLPESPAGVDTFTPFAFGDFTWLNGSPRTKDTVLDTQFFTPEIRFDTNFITDFNQPKDHTMGGSTEEFRSGEIQLEQASVGGDFHWENIRGRILFMMGMFATTTPRNDASAAVGQWDLRDAYRYISEAYGGYHFNVNHGLNIDAGIFASYIGLFSYYNFDNWTYQPSYVSSNTPWFFNGVRIQWFPTNKLKIEPWIINGWQAYAKYNGHLGLGGQILYMPREWLKLVSNEYGFGEDNLGLPKTQRIHTDNSIELRYYNNPNNGNGISKKALSFTADAGCQYGGGITCTGGPNKSSFLGWMLYDRTWFHHDLYAITLGGGMMSNPGRYLTLLPPINGADAVSGSPYFTESPGQKANMWDSTITLQYMPKQYITWWLEAGYRHSDVPYFSGRGGITPPGGNNGAPQYYACMSGASSGTANAAAAALACGGAANVWYPDLRRSTSSIGVGVMVKF